MIKKAFLINSLGNGGAEKVVQILANNFSNNSEVHLILLERNDFYPIDPKVKIKYLTKLNDSTHPLIKIILLPYLGYLLANYCKKNSINTVVSHLYRSNYVNVISKFFSKNYVANIVNHGTFSRYKVEGWLGKINLFLIKHLYKYADNIICVSKGMHQEFLEMFKINVPSFVINNPYEIDGIIDQSNEPIEDFIFRPYSIYLVTVGRLISLKRIEVIIQAVSKLVKNVNENRTIELLVIGEGIERERLHNLANELGIEEYIHFLGRKNNPFKYVAKSNLMLMASESEGFPNVLIEGLACRCPIISSDCDNGPREILAPSSNQVIRITEGVETGEYGILVPVGDIFALEQSVNAMLGNPQQMDIFSRIGLERARQFYKEIILKGYELLFKDLIKNN